MIERTYRKDLYYVNFSEGIYRNELVVSKLLWWYYRLQFWRFYKFKEFNVLREKDESPTSRR